MREQITIKTRSYSISSTGQYDASADVTVGTYWADVKKQRFVDQDLTGGQNTLEDVWVFRIRNDEAVTIDKSHFITWRSNDYSITSVSMQQDYNRMVEIRCNIIT